MKKFILATSVITALFSFAPTKSYANEPFLGEVMFVPYNFAPRGWAKCEGQLLPIAQNQALFSLLGTMYGGDGRTTFGLPDMRGRTPVHPGGDSNIAQGQKGGTDQLVLSADQLPAHSHDTRVSSYSARTSDPTGNVLARPRSSLKAYDNTSPNVQLNSDTVSNSGSNQAVDNMQPSTTLQCIIALQGTFPSRN